MEVVPQQALSFKSTSTWGAPAKETPAGGSFGHGDLCCEVDERGRFQSALSGVGRKMMLLGVCRVHSRFEAWLVSAFRSILLLRVSEWGIRDFASREDILWRVERRGVACSTSVYRP